jgi:hypothetical protein
VTKVRLNRHLGELGELGVDIGERIFQHFSVLRVLGGFKLLQDSSTGENEPIAFAFLCQLRGGKLWFGFIHRGNSFSLLILH